MKHIIFYGPGTSPNIIVSDEEAIKIKENFESGKSFDIKYGDNDVLYVRENLCWAMKVQDFHERRKCDRANIGFS